MRHFMRHKPSLCAILLRCVAGSLARTHLSHQSVSYQHFQLEMINIVGVLRAACRTRAGKSCDKSCDSVPNRVIRSPGTGLLAPGRAAALDNSAAPEIVTQIMTFFI